MVALAAILAMSRSRPRGTDPRPLLLLATIACLAVAISAAAYLITPNRRTPVSWPWWRFSRWPRRWDCWSPTGQLVPLLLLTALAALVGAAARYALGA